ncbi:MAG: hypothetical protein Q7R45_13305, partial [Sulfuricaulis sp.]|nr:hypothetical protein [Sulfuricaulis sp.]
MLSLRIICIAAGVLFGTCAAAQQIAVAIDRIDGPSFAASKITGTLRVADVTALDAQIAEVSIAGSSWRNVRMRCPELRQERDQLVCAQGVLETPARIPLSFRYSTLTKNLDLALKPAAGEEWRLALESHAAARSFTLAISNGLLTRLSSWWPAGWPQPNAGSASGKLVFSDGSAGNKVGNEKNSPLPVPLPPGERGPSAIRPSTSPDASHPRESPRILSGELTVANGGFGDASGLHAGEKIAATLALQAQQR